MNLSYFYFSSLNQNTKTKIIAFVKLLNQELNAKRFAKGLPRTRTSSLNLNTNEYL